MNGTPHVSPPDEEDMWCISHGCNSDDCPADDDEECGLIEMSEHAQAVHDDIMSNWFEEDAP